MAQPPGSYRPLHGLHLTENKVPHTRSCVGIGHSQRECSPLYHGEVPPPTQGTAVETPWTLEPSLWWQTQCLKVDRCPRARGDLLTRPYPLKVQACSPRDPSKVPNNATRLQEALFIHAPHAEELLLGVCFFFRSIGCIKSFFLLGSQNGLSGVDHLQSPKAWHPLWYYQARCVAFLCCGVDMTAGSDLVFDHLFHNHIDPNRLNTNLFRCPFSVQ